MKSRKKNKRIVLIYWNVRESDKLAANLRKKGSNVEISYEIDGLSQLRKLIDNPPNAIIIPVGRIDFSDEEQEDNLKDLDELSKSVPIIFIDGDEESKEKTKEQFPGAKFTTLTRLPLFLDEI